MNNLLITISKSEKDFEERLHWIVEACEVMPKAKTDIIKKNTKGIFRQQNISLIEAMIKVTEEMIGIPENNGRNELPTYEHDKGYEKAKSDFTTLLKETLKEMKTK